MRARTHCLAVALLCAAGCLAHAEEKRVAYKWVDENGVTHYGDRIPAQYATKESSVLNKQGVEVARTEAQKSPEEIAEEARAQETYVRQKQHDSFLLTTYTSVKDIESLRDERLEQISGQRRAAEAYIEGLHGRLSALQSRAMNFKPYNGNPSARRMPDDLAEDLMRTVNEMRSQKSALAVKDAEENALRSQFQSDIDRYRELRSVRPSR
ncbi:MAG: DUF4124 domain-containing protein [Gammaproteobacteria bacterium]